MGNISDGLQNVVDEIRSSREERNNSLRQLKEDNRVTISEIRSDAHNLVERSHQENEELIRSTRDLVQGIGRDNAEMVKGFQAEDTERKGAVSEMVEGFHKATSELREEIASGLRQAQQVLSGGFKREVEAAPAAEEVEEKPKVKVELPGVQRVLEVITGHAEGIRLIDIGNELGVDWRTLIGPTKSLVDGGQVEKIENMYYPK